jgi:hypothetical protein
LVACVLGGAWAWIATPESRAVTGCASTTALSFGAVPTAASIVAAAEKDCFTFTGAVNDRVRIRVDTTSGTLGTLMTLFNPSSSATCGGASKATEINCSINAAGTWTITVQDAAGTRTGNYRIAIQRLNNPVGCTAISSGATPTNGFIGSAAEMDCFTFTGAVGGRFRVRVAETSGTLGARDDVVRLDGTTVCAATTNLDLTCPLDAAGTHTIIVADNGGTQTGNYAIAIRRLDSNSGCTTLTFGAAPASATIAAAAELDCFRFTGAIGDRIRVSAGRTTGTVVPFTEIVRPNGTTVGCCGALDTAGMHTIIVGDSNGTKTGDYKISVQRLNNPVGCTPLSLNGAALAGVVESGEMDCYTFSGSDFDQIQVHLVTSSSSFASVTLFRPDGTFLCSESSNSSSRSVDPLCPLDRSGAHTIVFESSNLSTGYSLSARRMNNPAGCTPISFGGGPSTGSIADAEMDCYTFSAAAGDQVRIRRVETSNPLNPTADLFSADGQPADCFDERERTCAIDSTGSYTILVRDDPFSALETGTYAVAIQRLNNPVGCTPLSFGAAPFVGSITTAAEIDCYSFSGAPGGQIQIALPVTAGNFTRTWDVFDPSGQLVCHGPLPNPPCPLADTGTYAILVESASIGFVGTFDYSIAIQRLDNPPGPTCTGLAFGAAPTTASIGAAGEMDCYTFGGATGDQVRIRLTATSSTLLASNEVAQTDGTLVCGQTTALEVTCPIDSAGQHRIIVSDNSFDKKTGNYAIAIQRLNTPNNCAPLAFGPVPTAGTIGVATEMDCYSFTGTAGDRIRVHVTASSPLAKHGEIVRPNGTTLCSGLGSSSPDLTCRLDTTGNTRLLIDDTSGRLTGAYTVVIQRLNNPVGCTPLFFGDAPTAGTIAAAGEIECFTFTAAAGDRVEERAVMTSGTLAIAGELVRPNGTTVSSAACLPCSLDSPGTYTILVDDSAGTGTGDYALAIQRLNNPVGCTTIVFGAAPTTGTLGAAEMDCFTVAGATGDRIHANLVRTSGTPPLTAQLVSPSGNQVCVMGPQVFPPVFACGLTTAGTQTLIISGLIGFTPGAGDYALAVQRANNPVGCAALGFGGAPTTGTIAVAAENDCFTFTGNSGDRIRVRPIATSGTLQFQSDVLRPSGTVACENTPVGGSSPEFTCALTVTGTYTLVLGDSFGTRTGNYAVVIQRLNAPVGCTALPAAGTPAVGSISAAAELDCFTVAATAGVTIPLDLAQTSGTIVPQMEILRPNGTTQCFPTTAAHLDCKADTTGTYTVLVGDSFPRTRTGGYTITRSP